MARLKDLLGSMQIKVGSPDGNVHARLVNRGSIELEFEEESYYEYGHEEIEHQLTSLTRTLFIARLRGYREAFKQATGRESRQGVPHWRSANRKMRAELEETPMSGQSTDGFITLSSVGMQDWQVELNEHTLGELDESAFALEFQSAALDWVADFKEVMVTLKRSYAL